MKGGCSTGMRCGRRCRERERTRRRLPMRWSQISDECRSIVGGLLPLPKLPPAYGFGCGNIRGLCGKYGVVHRRHAQAFESSPRSMEKLLRAMRIADQLSRGAVSGRSSFLYWRDGPARAVCSPGPCTLRRARPVVRHRGRSSALRSHCDGRMMPRHARDDALDMPCGFITVGIGPVEIPRLLSVRTGL